jgi:6-pyruvoyltetrahydropterin/6-carboxytetrahydropterin synthase
MKVSIGKIITFESAHILPPRFGKCNNLHGHSYKLIIEVEGPIDTDGVVMDFADLKKIIKEKVFDRFDHKFLNDFLPLPSAENIAIEIFKVIDDEIRQLYPHLSIKKVTLFETENSFATVEK